jgi:hypothetical protein
VVLVEDHLPYAGRGIHPGQQVQLRYDEQIVGAEFELIVAQDRRGRVEPRQPVARRTEPQCGVDPGGAEQLDMAGLDPNPTAWRIRLLDGVDDPGAQIFSTGA